MKIKSGQQPLIRLIITVDFSKRQLKTITYDETKEVDTLTDLINGLLKLYKSNGEY